MGNAPPTPEAGQQIINFETLRQATGKRQTGKQNIVPLARDAATLAQSGLSHVYVTVDLEGQRITGPITNWLHDAGGDRLVVTVPRRMARRDTPPRTEPKSVRIKDILAFRIDRLEPVVVHG
jgi:hypothetical protein